LSSGTTPILKVLWRLVCLRAKTERPINRCFDRAGATCIGRARPHRGGAHRGRRRFSGQTHDGRYCRARYYHPGLHRFISEDPIEFAGGDVNLYAFVSSNPLNWVDPLGLDWQPPCLGAAMGEEAAFWWASRQVETGSDFYAVGGLLASLWMPESCRNTAVIFVTGLTAGGYLGRPYWQYFPKGNPGYQSSWLTRGWGWRPPYPPGPQAAGRLALPPQNPGTAVRPVSPRALEPVRGARPVAPANGQPGGGWEYFRGWLWP
jgi:RHS repeat-associated protein